MLCLTYYLKFLQTITPKSDGGLLKIVQDVYQKKKTGGFISPDCLLHNVENVWLNFKKLSIDRFWKCEEIVVYLENM